MASVLGQAEVAAQVLIVDDALTDDTPALAYRRHAATQGPMATFDEGLAGAEGDYTLLISADSPLPLLRGLARTLFRL